MKMKKVFFFFFPVQEISKSDPNRVRSYLIKVEQLKPEKELAILHIKWTNGQ